MFLESGISLIHYGDLNDGVVLSPVVLGGDVRPRGKHILWTSPSNSKYSWLDYCNNDYRTWFPERQPQKWQLLVERASLAVVKSYVDYRSLRRDFRHPEKPEFFDWVKLADRYDAFWLAGKAHQRYYGEFDRWDCETVVIFNTSVISSIEQLPDPLLVATK